MVTQLFTGRQCTWTALLLDACEVLIFLQENAYILKYIYIYKNTESIWISSQFLYFFTFLSLDASEEVEMFWELFSPLCALRRKENKTEGS